MSLLSEAKLRAMAEIDIAAGTARLRYITVTHGQDQIYTEKTNEAIDFITNKYPSDLSAFPFIAAEVDATGLQPQIVATIILQKRSEWIVKMAAIEKLRRKGKIDIQAAPGIKIINEVKQQYTEELNSL